MIPAFLRPEVVPYTSIEIILAGVLLAPSPINAHVDGQPLVVVCSWHTSPAELLALGRQFPGQVSHALCESCAAKFEAGATS